MSTIPQATVPKDTSVPLEPNRGVHLKRPKSIAILAVAVFILICISLIFAPPKWDLKSGLASSIDKHTRLELCRSPKIVFIGGSNVSLGLDSEAVQRALKRDVVNMGLGASLGLRYQLEEVRDEIKPGDLLIIMPEYGNFYFTDKDASFSRLNGSPDLIHLWQVYPRSSRWIWAVFSSSPETMIDGADDIRRFLYFKTNFYKKTLGQLVWAPNKFWSPDLLKPVNTLFTQRKNFNLYGDFVGHLHMQPPKLAREEPIKSGEYKEFDTNSSNFLNAYAAYAAARGASLVLLPPVFPSNLKCNDVTFNIYEHWKSLLKFPVLASPERYGFDWTELFDTPYHTNALGRARRTKMVIEDLKGYLATKGNSP
jgi:hypothetical protein